MRLSGAGLWTSGNLTEFGGHWLVVKLYKSARRLLNEHTIKMVETVYCNRTNNESEIFVIYYIIYGKNKQHLTVNVERIIHNKTFLFDGA